MKQRTLVGARPGVLDDQRSGRKRSWKFGLVKCTGGNDPGPRRRRPDHRQMRLARSLGSDQGECIGGPIRPTIDKLKRPLVARAG